MFLIVFPFELDFRGCFCQPASLKTYLSRNIVRCGSSKAGCHIVAHQRVKVIRHGKRSIV